MKAISLFSGCGGMDLGARRAGIETIFANDVMPEARDCFAKLAPDVEFQLGDVADVKSFPSADAVLGGYPCQSFSMGGHRKPGADSRSLLYHHFVRCVDQVNPRFFVAENVAGLKALNSGRWLREQVDALEAAGQHGYHVSWKVLRADHFGVPQRRRRLFIVGVRRDLGLYYWFPDPTHGSPADVERFGLKPFESHGEAIAGLPLWPEGEFYERKDDPNGNWSWYYTSRNRKAAWDGPSYTVLANYRHVTLHPASPTMRLEWSDLAAGWKQKWVFTDQYEHTDGHPERPTLEEPRRLSWREAAAIQTLPSDFEPPGSVKRKFELIGNAVPPLLMEAISIPLVNGSALRPAPPPGP